MTTIKEDMHLGAKCYTLSNDVLDIKVLKDFGAKIVSIYSKEKNYEFVYQPTKKSYKVPIPNASFEDYDTSGIDDMLPTIDSCYYPGTDIYLPDHGEIWSKKWDYSVKENTLLCRVYCDNLGLILERSMSLGSDKLTLDYTLENISGKDRYYLWAFHDLMKFDDYTRIRFDFEGKIVNVKNDDVYDFDYTDLSKYEDKKSYKFYFENEIKNGSFSIFQMDKKLRLDFSYDTDINKYLGVWVTKGGFKGEYNFAIEPTSAYYDDVETAVKNDKISIIKKSQILKWYIDICLNNI